MSREPSEEGQESLLSMYEQELNNASPAKASQLCIRQGNDSVVSDVVEPALIRETAMKQSR